MGYAIGAFDPDQVMQFDPAPVPWNTGGLSFGNLGAASGTVDPFGSDPRGESNLAIYAAPRQATTSKPLSGVADIWGKVSAGLFDLGRKVTAAGAADSGYAVTQNGIAPADVTGREGTVARNENNLRDLLASFQNASWFGGGNDGPVQSSPPENTALKAVVIVGLGLAIFAAFQKGR